LTKGENDLALRFDLTVPLARYIAEHEGELNFPFRRYSIGKVWRGERAQKGRYREFYQADIDIIGENELALAYDMEIMTVLAHCVGGWANIMGLKNGIEVRYSNRKIWDSFFNAHNTDSDTRAAVMNLVDKKRKMTEDKFDDELRLAVQDCNVRDDINKILNGDFVSLAMDTEELYELKDMLDDVPGRVSFIPDTSIVRGLDYYTGTVFETFIKGYEEVGSVASGGRYANLCANFTDKNFIGVGGSIGLSRFLVPLIESGKIPAKNQRDPLLLLIPLDKKFYSLAVATGLKVADDFNKDRENKAIIYSICKERKLKHHLEYANNVGAKFVGILGEDEFNAKIITVRNMATGEQQAVPLVVGGVPGKGLTDFLKKRDK
jgi:histidyl-tRNA synthetase